MHILGVYLDPPYLREALILKGSKGLEVRSLQATLISDILPTKHLSELPPSDEAEALKRSKSPSEEKRKQFYPTVSEKVNVKRLYITDFRGKIITGLSAKDSLIKSIELKIGNQRHLEEIIAFQSEATSHFNPKDILTVPLLSSKKGSAEALLFTVPKMALQHHLAEMEKWHIDPDSVGSIPEALCQFVRWKFPSLTDAFIIDLGSNEWTCAWMEKGQLKKAHAIAGGVESLLANLLEDRKRILLKKEIEGAAKQIDLLLLKNSLNPHLSGKLSELRQELTKVQYAFERGSEKKPILFTGRTDAFIHLPEFLIDGQESRWPLTSEEQKFAIPIGLALGQYGPQPLQFRREEFFPRKNWRKMGLYALSLLAASALLGGIFLFLGIHSIQERKQEMLYTLQSSSQKRKLHLEEGSMEEKIDRWIAAVETNNKEYPYIVQAPKVAEVLTWLSSNPLLDELKKEGDPIELRELRYQLVKFPKIGSTKDPYLAKVELDFTFKSAMNARRFHEELRKGDERVDPNHEITWDASSTGYRTTFFLKNRSPHVL